MRKTLVLASLFLLLANATPAAIALEPVWAKRIGGTSFDDGRSIAVDDAGNVYITGRFQGTVDFDPGPGTHDLTSAGSYDIFVSKLDGRGEFVWARRMGGSSGDLGVSIALDADGNVFTTGLFHGTVDFDPGPGSYNLSGSGLVDVFISKLDSSGEFVWARSFGGPGLDFSESIGVDGAGNLCVAGSFNETVDFDPGPGTHYLTSAGSADIFISCLDSDGDLAWAVRFGSTLYDDGRGISLDSAGNVYTTGRFEGSVDFDPGPGNHDLTSAGGSDIFISKLDSAGAFVWARMLGGSASDVGGSIAVDRAGNVYTTGQFQGDADFDPGPGTHDLASAGEIDIFVSKLDSGGEFVWARGFGGIYHDTGYSIAVDGAGNAFTTGAFSFTVDFDPGPGTDNLTSVSDYDVFILKLDANGEAAFARRLGGTLADWGYSIAVDGVGNVYTTGLFDFSIDFDPGPGADMLISAGPSDAYIAKFGGACEFFSDRGVYGTLLFPPLCARDASELPGGPGVDHVYASTVRGVNRQADDAFHLSSDGLRLAPLAVDDAVRCNGVDSGLGPFDYQSGVPPFDLDVPVEYDLVPLPPHDISPLIPQGSSPLLFELVDTQREIYGNTAVYLVRDCGIYLESGPEVTLNWVSYDVTVNGSPSNLDAVSGLLSELRTDQDFASACNLGSFTETTQVADSRPDPAAGDGFYYLVDGTCAQPIGYGNSTSGPRKQLPPGNFCP